jgi:hypothetical protein
MIKVLGHDEHPNPLVRSFYIYPLEGIYKMNLRDLIITTDWTNDDTTHYKCDKDGR